MDPIYHYTNISSALSILQYKQLYMTQIDFLNDSEETSLLAERFYAEVFKKFSFNKSDNPLSEAAKDIVCKEIFTTSFCLDPFVLPMWGYYAQGQGIVIEFSFLSSKRNMISRKGIDYLKDEEIEEIVKNALEELPNKIDGLKFPIAFTDAERKLFLKSLDTKHDMFAHEQEVRLEYRNIITAELGDPIKFSKQIKFRHTGSSIKPYIEMGFEDLGIRPSKIIVPRKAANADETLVPGLKELIRCYYSRNLVANDYEVPVEIVDLPLR